MQSKIISCLSSFRRQPGLLSWLVVLVLFSSCASTKFVPEKRYLLDRVEITSTQEHFNAAALEPFIRQKANSKWFSLFKIPLGTYSLSGKDSTKWLNRTLKKLGEQPVLYDSVQARLSCQDLLTALQNLGYMHSRVVLHTRVHGRKIDVHYLLDPGVSFLIGSVDHDIRDTAIARLLQDYHWQLKAGSPFTVDHLNEERKAVTAFLNDRGYLRFHKDFIQYNCDTIRGSRNIAVHLVLLPYRANSRSPETLHPRYFIRQVNFLPDENDKLHLRRKVLEDNTALKVGEPFSNTDLQQTYHNFARMAAVRYTNINFREVRDSLLPDSLLTAADTLHRFVDAHLQVSMNKPSSIAFQPEGTNTAGDLGAAASLTYTNRNLFRGSEQLSVELRGAFEAITGLEGYKDQNYQEYSVSTKLAFPRFVAPFLSRSFRRRQTATSELSVSWDLQNRPEFHRRVFSTAWRYRWEEPHHHLKWRFDLLDLNYVYMPWISETFRHDYLDSASNRNAILRYNYEDLFIMKMGLGISYNNGVDAVRANIETAGNLLDGLAHLASFKQNNSGQYTLFNIAFAQYAKFDFDYTHLLKFDRRNTLALHADFGIAYPYGNSTILPFEKRYFSGGANSVRGWSVRGLGPGKFKGTDGRIDFINQTGDMKLDLNAEMRSHLFWKLEGAAFIDAGNIWTIRDYADQPGGQFLFKDFYKEIAVAYGLGLRLNFDYFILRFDFGMKAINPAYDNEREHWAIFHPDLSRDFCFHFAVGLPF
ncbi:MAG: BamA/TamA family outer membrane protein [Prevotella sp.]|nr:BamA/TamA family outer membrane protein [Prevotella sp.]